METGKTKKQLSEREVQDVNVRARLNLGKEFLRAGNYERALQMFEEALKIDAASVRARWGQSLALTRLSRYGEALAAAETIFLYEENSPSAYNARAVCYHATGFTDKARESFEQSITYGPEVAGNHYNFACFWAAQGAAQRCREYLTRALELEPNLNAIAATDVDLKRYRNDDWFLELVAFK